MTNPLDLLSQLRRLGGFVGSVDSTDSIDLTETNH